MNKSSKTHRLFFALWPTDKIRSSIGDVISKYPQPGGRLVESTNLHMTLHFLGQVTEPAKDCMHVAAQSVTAEGFQLNLDNFGHFPKAKIFWMGSQNMPAQLDHLHKKLGDAIADCGFKCETRPFSPHVTLMRKCSKPDTAQSEFSLPWCIEEFVLVESITYKEGVNYQVIEKYPLS